MIVPATYTSVFDNSITCKSKCKYNLESKTAFDIQDAENAEDADSANGLTDEYVTVNGKKLRDADGVHFEY